MQPPQQPTQKKPKVLSPIHKTRPLVWRPTSSNGRKHLRAFRRRSHSSRDELLTKSAIMLAMLRQQIVMLLEVLKRLENDS